LSGLDGVGVVIQARDRTTTSENRTPVSCTTRGVEDVTTYARRGPAVTLQMGLLVVGPRPPDHIYSLTRFIEAAHT
jgi:hypothetical protein